MPFPGGLQAILNGHIGGPYEAIRLTTLTACMAIAQVARAPVPRDEITRCWPRANPEAPNQVDVSHPSAALVARADAQSALNGLFL